MKGSTVRSIVTARHSVTGHNAAKIISGRIDEPLSDEGREFARQLAMTEGALSGDTVIASPTRRAIETATIMTRVAEPDIRVEYLCIERDYGVFQGLNVHQVKKYADQVTYISVGGIKHSLNPPGGETFEQVRVRACRFYESLLSLTVESVLVFSHQVFLQQFHGILLELDTYESLRLDIRPLQIDRFTLADCRRVVSHMVRPGMERHRSW